MPDYAISGFDRTDALGMFDCGARLAGCGEVEHLGLGGQGSAEFGDDTFEHAIPTGTGDCDVEADEIGHGTTSGREIGHGTTSGRELGSRDFDVRAGLVEVLGRVVAEVQSALRRGGDDEGAAAGLRLPSFQNLRFTVA